MSKLSDHLKHIASLAAVHGDEDVDPDDTSPSDMWAHVDGLILREARAAVLRAEEAMDFSQMAWEHVSHMTREQADDAGLDSEYREWAMRLCALADAMGLVD